MSTDEKIDIIHITKDIIDQQVNLLKDKSTILSLADEVNAKVEQTDNESPIYKGIKGLSNLFRTWIKVLDLWEELHNKMNSRLNELIDMVKLAEDQTYLELKPFSEKFDELVNSTSFLAVKAFDANRFEELLNDFSLISKLPNNYISTIKQNLGSIESAQNFINLAKRNSHEFKYFHLKYGIQLVGDEQLDNVQFLEKEMDDVKEGEYKIPDDRKAQVIQKLISSPVAISRTMQKQFIDKIKTYKPMTEMPIADSPTADGPKIIDF